MRSYILRTVILLIPRCLNDEVLFASELNANPFNKILFNEKNDKISRLLQIIIIMWKNKISLIVSSVKTSQKRSLSPFFLSLFFLQLSYTMSKFGTRGMEFAADELFGEQLSASVSCALCGKSHYALSDLHIGEIWRRADSERVTIRDGKCGNPITPPHCRTLDATVPLLRGSSLLPLVPVFLCRHLIAVYTCT